MSVSGHGVEICTSSTRPASPVEGMQIFETDTDKLLVYNGSSWIEISDLDNTNAFPAAASDLNNFFSTWTSYTPQVTQGASVNISKTLDYAKYIKIGRLVIGSAFIRLTSTGSGGSSVTVTCPITAASSQGVVGSCWIYDADAGVGYGGQTGMNSTTTFSFQGDWSGGSAWGASPNIGLQSNDQIRLNFIYEASA